MARAGGGRDTAAAALLLWAVFAAGCGYHSLAGHGAWQGQSAVCLRPFAEAPSTGLSAAMATHLARLLAAEGLRLQASCHDAAQLSGHIEVFTAPAASRAGVAAYALAASLQVRLQDSAGATLLEGSTRVEEEFLPEPLADAQPLATERQRRFAIARLAERAARAVHRLLQDA